MFSVTTLFNYALMVMLLLALVVFFALFKIDAAYGFFRSKTWGPCIPNKVGWFLMEFPVLAIFSILFLYSERSQSSVFIVFFLIFQLHYLHRTFVFPLLMRGKSRMPISIVLMGASFNTINAFLQGGWLFYIAPENYYNANWLTSPLFIIGFAIFLCGMWINIQSDAIIRNLRKPGDNNHYMPKAKWFKRVSSANYFGECIEWLGFACLTYSLSGLVFFIWTFANLAPRAIRLNKSYQERFPVDFQEHKPKAIIPFIL
ncbi:MAG: hypothetical protein WC966_01430 [Bradymonadales bacterium]|jgi:3-oxo-5-alpha-steroid 4-dehydrogenase 1